MKVLIVEDDRIVAENLKETLQDFGYRVIRVVDSGEHAIQTLKKQEADLILMDVRLKGPLDGIQTALLLHETVKEVPIIFLTAHSASQFSHLTRLRSSLYRYLTKPYSDAQLMATFREFDPNPETD